MGRVLANRFELGPRVGKGSLSIVHEAIDRESSRRVAIKLLHPEVAALLGRNKAQRHLKWKAQRPLASMCASTWDFQKNN